jgi:predicted esterase
LMLENFKMKMKLLYILLILLNIINCSKSKMNNTHYQTYSHDLPIPYKYTLFTYNEKNNTILYFFHGSDGNELSWMSQKELINLWKNSHDEIPNVVGITFGKKSLLLPEYEYHNKKMGSLNYFVKNIIPRIEKEINIKIKKRFALGISMGGFSVSQLVFRYPELFDKAAIISPAIYPISLYSSDKEIEQFINQVKAELFGVKEFIKLHIFKKDTIKNNIETIIYAQRKIIPDQEIWEKTSIINNMRKPPKNNKLKIYISCGKNDEFGLFFGSKELYEKARELKYPVKLSLLKGGHSIKNNKEIVDFFIDKNKN